MYKRQANNNHYDLIVIGAGSGGVRAARIAANYGAKVAIVESVRVGGTCVLRGCVPKKLLVYGSHFAKEIEDSEGFGWQISSFMHDWSKLISNKDKELDRLNKIYLNLLSKVKIINGFANIISNNEVQVNGEILSTTIIFSYLKIKGLDISFLDARKCIKTDNYYRDSNLDWDITVKRIKKEIKKGTSYVTQGFIGSDNKGNTTTLGREGSDYSASIFAYSLNAKDVTIWKDVPGVLNADPRFFSDTTLLTNISYSEAIELAFYGASVIHPKTLQPLQKKEIPLLVKPFSDPNSNGTKITRGIKINPKVPCFIVKNNLSLIKLSSLDFSFIVDWIYTICKKDMLQDLAHKIFINLGCCNKPVHIWWVMQFFYSSNYVFITGRRLKSIC